MSLAAPLGPHELLLDAAEELLAAQGISPDPTTAVLLYAAGSSDSDAVATVGHTIAEHPREGWGPWGVAALEGGSTIDQLLRRLPDEVERTVVVSFMVAEGVLRDRMAQHCGRAGVSMVAGALAQTSAGRAPRGSNGRIACPRDRRSPAPPAPARDARRAVLTVTLANPARRNAQTPSLWAALAAVAEGLDPQVRVVVLRGDGPSFSAGIDLAMLAPGGVAGEVDMVAMAAGSAEAAAEVIEGFQRGFSAWAAVPAVVVAAVQGHAIGAGFQLALAADLRVVAEDVQFAMRETSLGLVPDLAGTTPLVSLVGVARALEICATGRFVGANRGGRHGAGERGCARRRPGGDDRRPRGGTPGGTRGGAARAQALLHSAASADRADQLRLEREAQGRLLHGLANPRAARLTGRVTPAAQMVGVGGTDDGECCAAEHGVHDGMSQRRSPVSHLGLDGDAFADPRRLRQGPQARARHRQAGGGPTRDRSGVRSASSWSW